MSRFMQKRFGTLSEYVPGEQPNDQLYIKLNTNESPFSPPERVANALRDGSVRDLRLYCDPTCEALRAKLAVCYGVEPDQIYLANGSDDILNFAFLAFGGDGVVYPQISYGFYSVFAALHGIAAEEIPLRADFSIDAADYCGKQRMIVLANPNAPTGVLLSLEQIEQIVASNPDHVVLIDEAYIDFGGESALPLIQTYDNLLVVQTFSKSRSMAGARLGYAFGGKALIADLEKLKFSTNPYNINSMAQAAALAALEEEDYFAANCREIMRVRAYTAEKLRQLGFTVTDSKANFVFAASERVEGTALYQKLRQRGILVRHFSDERISNYNRITIGSMAQMQQFIETVTAIMEEAE